jgi:hypothetical protein
MDNHGPQSEPIAPLASAEEAAAIVAAMELFARSTAAPGEAVEPGSDPWQRAAALEAVEREPGIFARDPWINT